MKKRAITLLTALVLITVLLLTACGIKNGNDAGKTTEIPAGTEQPATNAPTGNSATDVPTAAPTEEPVPTEKDPLSEIDALMVELDDPINYRTSGSEAEMRDGSRISARGSNAFPQNYGAFTDYLWNLVHS